LVISAHNKNLTGYADFPGDTRTDVVYITDPRGWYIRYSHLDSIYPSIQPGVKVKKGEPIGLVGKKGASGGWVHLHFEIKNKETLSGEWEVEQAYAYAWEAYVNEYNPDLLAVARPHYLSYTGEEIVFDGRKSKSFGNGKLSYQWQFSDGEIVDAPVAIKKYEELGEYSEILKVSDSNGNVDYDFSVVQVYNKEEPQKKIPTIQASFFPTVNIKAGEAVAFFVRTFNMHIGNEVFDFGDESPEILVKSNFVKKKEASKGKFAQTLHTFKKPGIYIVSVERENENGFKATVHLKVEVKE